MRNPTISRRSLLNNYARYTTDIILIIPFAFVFFPPVFIISYLIGVTFGILNIFKLNALLHRFRTDTNIFSHLLWQLSYLTQPDLFFHRMHINNNNSINFIVRQTINNLYNLSASVIIFPAVVLLVTGNSIITAYKLFAAGIFGLFSSTSRQNQLQIASRQATRSNQHPLLNQFNFPARIDSQRQRWQEHDHLFYQGYIPAHRSDKMSAREFTAFLEPYDAKVMETRLLSEEEIKQYDNTGLSNKFGCIESLIDDPITFDRFKNPATLYKVYADTGEIVADSERTYDLSTLREMFTTHKAEDPFNRESIFNPRTENRRQTKFKCRLGYSSELTKRFRDIKEHLAKPSSTNGTLAKADSVSFFTQTRSSTVVNTHISSDEENKQESITINR